MATIKGLDARDRPPEKVRDVFKTYLHIKAPDIALDADIIDLEKVDVDCLPAAFEASRFLDSKSMRLAFDEFMGKVDPSAKPAGDHGGGLIEDVPVFTHKKVSGNDIGTGLHKERVCQSTENKAKGASFFEANPTHIILPKDPDVNKPIAIQGMLDKQLRWIKLDDKPPATPTDISHLLRAALQSTTVNIYSAANDTVGMHRDVSEESNIRLVSVSMGCDALFMIGHDGGEGCGVIRLRSGDAVSYLAS
ncbi:hypothetical protein UA08_03478 [Talaromyces atroroseus]|uniref:Alpha-ketoglutarate-dependent dioxygenase AlkB-like domain-containing protein n=1 Tax=Talaromyces atroroseus TaxID=1441469 RepID=A0A225B2F8_TALAT|nr:hypothetical protein UA08_03478 [Talaromyces atroroseus]OKL61436.1 hypothetical protein UA08_03478 [Talaromyces atroroseus]